MAWRLKSNYPRATTRLRFPDRLHRSAARPYEPPGIFRV
jgi:hypothetical protein